MSFVFMLLIIIVDLYQLVLQCVTAVSISTQAQKDGTHDKSIKWVKVCVYQ